MKKMVKQTLGSGLVCAMMLGLAGNLPEAVRPWSGVIQAEAAATFSDFWFQDEQGNWKVRDESGNVVTNAWLCDDAVPANGKDVWYLLDANGCMISAGLVQDGTGNFYSIETNHDGYYGMLRYQSQVYDGISLELEAKHEGSFARILNQEGAAALAAKYGVTAAAIDNSHCVYTSSFGSSPAAGGKSSGGGGGRGGSGGSSSGSSMAYDYDVDSEWENYSDNSVSYAANDFTNGNYSRMTADERSKLQEAIEEFKNQYITSGMSDFEKEIKIIEWLVENCSYERGDGWENATAYSCIVNGRAQCSGYADAFLQTAKACGIDARYIYNKTHAWNLVKLDGDWYHVDVTWEDPIGSGNSYGFGNLRNAYINLEDNQIRGISSHHDWSPASIKAKGIKYGPRVVKKYMSDGVTDTSLGISFKDNMDKFFASVRNEDGSNIISYTNVEDTASQIIAYISRRIDERQSNFEFVVRYGSEYTAGTSGNYSRVSKLGKEMKEKVNAEINSRYGSVLKNQMKINLFLEEDADVNYYSHTTGNLYYQPGQGLQVPYTIHLVCGGTEVYTQTGTAERSTSVSILFPEGYSWISTADENYTISAGKGSYGGKTFRVTGRTPFEMSVNVRNTAKNVPGETKQDRMENRMEDPAESTKKDVEEDAAKKAAVEDDKKAAEETAGKGTEAHTAEVADTAEAEVEDTTEAAAEAVTEDTAETAAEDTEKSAAEDTTETATEGTTEAAAEDTTGTAEEDTAETAEDTEKAASEDTAEAEAEEAAEGTAAASEDTVKTAAVDGMIEVPAEDMKEVETEDTTKAEKGDVREDLAEETEE